MPARDGMTGDQYSLPRRFQLITDN
jgi:hypothetical protein